MGGLTEFRKAQKSLWNWTLAIRSRSCKVWMREWITSLALSLSLSLTHTHTKTHTRENIHTHRLTHIHAHNVPLYHTHTYKLTFPTTHYAQLSLNYILLLPLPSLSLSHTRTPKSSQTFFLSLTREAHTNLNTNFPSLSLTTEICTRPFYLKHTQERTNSRNVIQLLLTHQLTHFAFFSPLVKKNFLGRKIFFFWAFIIQSEAGTLGWGKVEFIFIGFFLFFPPICTNLTKIWIFDASRSILGVVEPKMKPNFFAQIFSDNKHEKNFLLHWYETGTLQII